MKRKILLSVLGAVVIVGLSNQQVNAQTFIASFGVEQSWGVPVGVANYIDDYYYGYEWVHTRRVVRHGMVDFEVIMQRGPVFVVITMDRYGRVYRTVNRDYYPLNEHVCGAYCGYHNNYYRNHYVVCTGHTHYGHNHVNYYSRPRGNAYGYYKNHNYYLNRKYGYNNHRHEHGTSNTVRRGNNNNGNNGVRDHGKGYGKSGRYSDNGRGKGRSSGKASNGKRGRSNVTSSGVRVSGR